MAGVSGGAGASTLAALLAQVRARRGRSVLVDLAGGGGLDVLLGLEQVPGARWPDLSGLRGTVAAEDLDGLLPQWHGVEVLSAARHGEQPPAEAVAAAVAGFAAAGASVVVDVAARGPQAWGSVADLIGLGGEVLLVAGQDVQGLAAVLAARAALRQARPHLVLRRRVSRIAPFELAHVADLPLVGLLPHDRRIADAVDRGLGPVAGRRLRRAVSGVERRLGGGR